MREEGGREETVRYLARTCIKYSAAGVAIKGRRLTERSATCERAALLQLKSISGTRRLQEASLTTHALHHRLFIQQPLPPQAVDWLTLAAKAIVHAAAAAAVVTSAAVSAGWNRMTTMMMNKREECVIDSTEL